MSETYRARVTISAPAGTHNVLSTLDGWASEGDGVYLVTDREWRSDVAAAFGATILDVVTETDDE